VTDPAVKPFHFLADGRAAASGKELAEKARRAESMGFHALVVPDHLVSSGQTARWPSSDRGRRRDGC